MDPSRATLRGGPVTPVRQRRTGPRRPKSPTLLTTFSGFPERLLVVLRRRIGPREIQEEFYFHINTGSSLWPRRRAPSSLRSLLGVGPLVPQVLEELRSYTERSVICTAKLVVAVNAASCLCVSHKLEEQPHGHDS